MFLVTDVTSTAQVYDTKLMAQLQHQREFAQPFPFTQAIYEN